MKKNVGILLLIVIAGILSQPAYAESRAAAEKPWEKFSINLGGFISTIDSNLRIGANGLAVNIDLEDMLGLDSEQSVFRVDGIWRFSDNRRHRFDLGWFSYKRESTKQVLNDFDVEGPGGSRITVPAGTTVESNSDVDIFKGTYSYSFIQDDRVDLGLSIGLYVMPIKTGLKAAGLVDVSEAASFTAPLPVLGLRADIAITPKWFLRFGSELFYLEYDNFKGSLVNAFTKLEYNPWKHVGLGLGVESLRLKIDSESNDYPGIDFNGDFEFNYTGLEIYTKIFF
jgi:hypothetical protein